MKLNQERCSNCTYSIWDYSKFKCSKKNYEAVKAHEKCNDYKSVRRNK